MSSSLEMLSVERGSARLSRRWRGRSVLAADRGGAALVRLLRYLPLVAFTTASVVVPPAVLVTVLLSRGSVLALVASVGLAMATSIAIATAEAAMWKRRRGSRDILFADLLLWGWLHRYWTERRLARARALYDAARKAGPAASMELLASLSKLLEARDAYTDGHSQRVARHAERIARTMRLSAVEIAKVRRAAAVHDVGKLYTPREILNNPKRLNDGEFAVMRRHAADGGNMMAAVGDLEIAAMVRHHHERIDGRGYPDGLVGEDIPLGARIIAVADTFDSITSNRAYRPAGTQKKALDTLSREAGFQLDAAAVAAFCSSYSARRSVAWFAFATAVPQRILSGLQSTPASLVANVGGATSMLPALGAAALLTLSPGLRHTAPVHRGTPFTPKVTRSQRVTIQALPAAEAPRQDVKRAANSPPASRDPRQSHRIEYASPSTPAAGNPTASTPNGPPSAPGTGTHEPVAVAPTPAPTPNAPTPTPPAIAPPTSGAPPPLPVAPVNPPVTIPHVTLPNVTVPNVKLPTVTTPTIEVPTIELPTVGVRL
jgi:HD-GYP domain-containing protein (c-di-GMP phosphodiesterase class II)